MRQMFTAIHLRRQIITHMVGNIDLLYPAVKQGILENYGWQEDSDDDDSMEKVGPFSIYSWAYYMKQNLVLGDSLILTLLALIWSIRLTVVGSRSLHEVRFRHDLDLEFTDIALVHNTSEGNGHYSGLMRRNQEVCSTKELAYSKKWNKEKDAAERLSLMQEGALDVIKKAEIQLSIVKTKRIKELEGKGDQLAKISKILKRKRGEGEVTEDKDEDQAKRRREEIVVREKDIQEVNPGDVSCKKCKKDFPKTSLLMRHIDKYHKHIYMFNCRICNKGFLNIRGYEEHKQQHGEKSFRCGKCNVQMASKRALNQHRNEICSEEAKKKKGFDCEYCGAGPFKVKRYIIVHYKKCKANPNRGDPMQCTICGEKNWHTLSNLNRHKKEKHNVEIRKT